VDWMCQKLQVPRSSYYRWTKPAEPTPTQLRNEQLTRDVCRVFEREKGMAGRDQITTILGHEGISAGPSTSATTCSMRTAGGTSAPPFRERSWQSDF